MHLATTDELATSLAADLRRQAVALAVGALDAYFCDAYVDVLAGSLGKAKAGTRSLPSAYKKELLPAGAMLAAYNNRPNWGLRMAARERMEKDNMLRLSRIKEMFNPVLPGPAKLWDSLMPRYRALNRKRLTKYTHVEIASKTGTAESDALGASRAALMTRMGAIVQRRHDIVHNCDRPKQSLLSLTPITASRMVADVRSFVEIFDDHLAQHRLA